MQNDKLLPCPFCGGEAKIEWEAWKDISDTSGIYRLTVKHSEGCYFEEMIGLSNKGQMVDTNKEKIVKAWNTRKPVERIADRLEEMFKHHSATKTVQRLVLETVKDWWCR